MSNRGEDMAVFKSTDRLLYEGKLGDKAVIYCRRYALVYEKYICNNDCLAIHVTECIPYDGYKIFKILGGYAPSRTCWYYLLDTSRVAVKRSGDRLDDIPGEGELTVPKEVLADRWNQFDVDARLVSRLLLIIVARNVRAERDVGGQVMQFPVPEELHVLVLFINETGEGLEWLGIGRPAVLHRPAVVVGVFIDVLRVIEMLLTEGVAEREVGGIPRHGILHRPHVKLEARNREIL